MGFFTSAENESAVNIQGSLLYDRATDGAGSPDEACCADSGMVHTAGWRRERLIRPTIKSIPASLKYPFRNKHGIENQTLLTISLL